MTSGHSLQRLDADANRAGERLGTFQKELQRVAAECAEQCSLEKLRRHEVSRFEEQRATLEQEVASGQDHLLGLRDKRDGLVRTASEQMAKVAAMQERQRAAEAGLQRIEALLREGTDRLQALRLQADAAAAEKSQRETENLAIEVQLASLIDERATVGARERDLQVESEQIRARIEAIDQLLKEARQLLEQSRDKRGELSANAAKLQSDAQYMGETCLNELGITRQQLAEDTTVQVVAGEQLAQEDAVYRQMRAHLDSMGPVNMMALEEYKETAERHQFLEQQRKDLLESIDNTQKTIREIDTVSRQKFQEAFNHINENFQLTFRKLFGGGHAFMRLTDEENAAESGIDVVASPPGKRLQNVLLLSGGEKALTALSLLVGIFQYQPSPFCILDEVDAPLDEANIGRFTDLVKEMSVQTQFVLITHSKKTMSIAPVMYGVTMQEPGVSKLVSVRFGA